jgi:colanic acid/amylovoran biosynthesis glycosyltransferase
MNADSTPTKVGLLIPAFPQQTHCAWWRVGNAFRAHGVEMQMLSTRAAPPDRRCHDFLIEESKRTHYCWPPRVNAVLGRWLRQPGTLFAGVRYVLGMGESSVLEKLKALPLIPAATDLAAFAERAGLDAIFVHSCANAAHIVAICRVMGGPPYALRLGGDLEVYGKDHRSKMQRAAFIASSAPNYFDSLQRDAGVEADRLMWTWVGADLERFTPGERNWSRRDPDELRVVTVARLTDTKGHEDVLQAIAILRDRGIRVVYTMIGTGPEEENLRRRAQELGVTDRIRMVGAKSMDEVVSYLRSADASVLASYGLGESSPAVVAEAMACGVPVVCTRIGATPSMLEDAKHGLLVPQRDPNAMADALQTLATDEARREDMARAAHAHSGIFDCREVARRVLVWFGLVQGEREVEPTLGSDAGREKPVAPPAAGVSG